MCKYKRCLDPDECVPLTCGVVFQNGSNEQWSCVLCGWKGSSTDDILQPVEKQETLASQAASIKARLQSGVDEAAFRGTSVAGITSTSASRFCTGYIPCHWILSILASSFARMLMKEGQTSTQVAGALRLSALCQLHLLVRVQRNVSIV